MAFSEKDMCNGTGHYFSLFWAMECPNGVVCWGCAGCYWDRFLDMWNTIGECEKARHDAIHNAEFTFTITV